MKGERVDTQDALEKLSEEAANDEVKLLIEVLETEFLARQQLEETVEDLERRLRRIEAQVGLAPEGAIIDDPHFDRRDQSVLEVLSSENPDSVTVSYLQKLYQKHTDIRQDETLRNRIKLLTEHGPFEYERGNRWQYTGIEV